MTVAVQGPRIELKSPREINLLRQAGHLSARILMDLKRRVEPGMTTRDIDEQAAAMMRDAGAVPSFLNYRGYPATVCASAVIIVIAVAANSSIFFIS